MRAVIVYLESSVEVPLSGLLHTRHRDICIRRSVGAVLLGILSLVQASSRPASTATLATAQASSAEDAKLTPARLQESTRQRRLAPRFRPLLQHWLPRPGCSRVCASSAISTRTA